MPTDKRKMERKNKENMSYTRIQTDSCDQIWWKSHKSDGKRGMFAQL